MTLKGDAKLKEKLTIDKKIDLRSLVNFYASSRKSENLHLNRLLLIKLYIVIDEKLQKSYL